MKGAATCFYAFIGFDIIATTGEEARTPRESIPKAIITSILIVTVAYVSCSGNKRNYFCKLAMSSILSCLPNLSLYIDPTPILAHTIVNYCVSHHDAHG